MNIREKAVIDLVRKFKEFDITTQDDFIREVFKRVSDNNLFALYVEVFGKPVEVQP